MATYQNFQSNNIQYAGPNVPPQYVYDGSVGSSMSFARPPAQAPHSSFASSSVGGSFASTPPPPQQQQQQQPPPAQQPPAAFTSSSGIPVPSGYTTQSPWATASLVSVPPQVQQQQQQYAVAPVAAPVPSAPPVAHAQLVQYDPHQQQQPKQEQPQIEDPFPAFAQPAQDQALVPAAAAAAADSTGNTEAIVPIGENGELASPEMIKEQERELAYWQKKRSNKENSAGAGGAMVPYNNAPLPRVPNSRNPTGSDAVHPDKKVMKQNRKIKTAAGVAGGAVVGTLVLGPVGTVLGGAAAGYAANKISKNGERRAQRKFEQANFQHAALQKASKMDGAFC